MKALICPSLGPAENLEVGEVEQPSPGEGEALVEVAYAGLNFFDTLIIEGKYQLKPGARGFAAGDPVMGFCGYGAAAERIAITTKRLARIPDGLPLDKAAGLS